MLSGHCLTLPEGDSGGNGTLWTEEGKLLLQGRRWKPGCLLAFCCQGLFLMGTYCSTHPALLHWHWVGESQQDLSCVSHQRIRH